jgi:exopolysaccharide production protein ExoQ
MDTSSSRELIDDESRRRRRRSTPREEATPSGADWLSRLGLADEGDVGAGRRRTRATAKRVAMIALLIFVLLGPIMTFGGLNITAEGTVERQVGYVAILALSLYAVYPGATRASMIAMPIPLLVAFGWCWLSIVWSVDPGSSFRRLGLTTIVAWTIFLLVRNAPTRMVIDTLRWGLLAAIVISYLVVFAAPVTGTHTMIEAAIPTALIGNWRGFLGHKNFAGAVCAMCIILFAFDVKRYPWYLRVGAYVIAGYFLFRTQSKTSAGMLALALLGGAMFETLSRRLRNFLLPILLVASTTAWVVINGYKDVLQANFLNPAAFTGRGHIWFTLLSYAHDHLLLGSGFGAFWNIGPQSPVFQYGQGYVTEISVGHSGYIDQLVAVGLPGLLLMVFAAMVWPVARVVGRTDLSPQRGGLIAAMLIFCIGHNTTESGLFERDAIVSGFLFIAGALALFAEPSRLTRSSGSGKGAGDDVMQMLRQRHRPVVMPGH